MWKKNWVCAGGVGGILAAVLMSVAPARAQSISSPPGAIEPAAEAEAFEISLDETLIVAERSLQRAFEIARSVEVISRAALARALPESVADALQGAGGVHSQKTNAGAGSPILRGMVGVDNLILVDGIRYNNSTFRTGPSQYLALLDPWSLERVEVIRGPGSVWYGSDALGGVLNLVTLEPRQLDGRLFGGSGRLLFQSATLGGGGSAQAEINAGLLSGYLGGTYLYHGELRAGGGVTQQLSDYARLGGRLKLNQDMGGGWSLTQAAMWNAIDGAGRVDSLGVGRVRNYDNQDLLAYVRLTRKGTGWGKLLRLNASYHQARELVLDWRCNTTESGVVLDRSACADAASDLLKLKEQLDDTVHTIGFFAAWEAQSWDGRFKLVAGADIYFDYVQSGAKEASADTTWAWKEKSRGSFSDGSTYATMGIFASASADVLKFDTWAWNLGAGVRFSGFQAQAQDVPGIGDVDYQQYAPVFSATTKVLWSDMLNVYLDFSQGFRSPNLQESTVLGLSSKSYDVPNDDLLPAKSNALEFGAKLRHPVVQVTAALFGNWMKDMFVRTELPKEKWAAMGITEEMVGTLPVYQRVNTASAFYRGVEGSVTVGPFEGVSLFASAAWMDGDVEDASGKSVQGTRIPPLMGAGGVRFEQADWGLTAEAYVRWATRQENLGPEDYKDLRICEDPRNPGVLLSEDACNGTPGWVTFHVRAGYSVWQSLQLNLALDNLSDEYYKYHGSGIYGPGFNVTASVSGTY